MYRKLAANLFCAEPLDAPVHACYQDRDMNFSPSYRVGPNMTAKLKSVKPVWDEDDDFLEFIVDVEIHGKVRTIRHVHAEKLLDQHELAVVVAENLGCLMRKEADWRHALADAWQAPESKPDCRDESDEEEEMVLSEERIAIADGRYRPSELLYFH